MSTHHQQQSHGWNNNVYHSDTRPENSINYKTVVRPPVISTTTTTTRPPSTHFLPTLPPISNSMMHFTQLEGKLCIYRALMLIKVFVLSSSFIKFCSEVFWINIFFSKSLNFLMYLNIFLFQNRLKHINTHIANGLNNNIRCSIRVIQQ